MPVAREVQYSELSTDELSQILKERDDDAVRDLVQHIPGHILAGALNETEDLDVIRILGFLDIEEWVEIFEHLEFDRQLDLVQQLPLKKIVFLLNEISPDDRTAFFEQLPEEQLRRWLNVLSPDERKMANTLLHYPVESIGRLMTPEFISVQQGWTMETALAHIRKHGPDSETLNVIYIVDDQGALIDDLKIREILLSPLDMKVSEIMDGQYVALNAYEDQETAIQIFKDTDRFALPVTDLGGLLVGIVTIDDLLDVIEREDTEDIHKFGGSEAFNEPYFKISFFEMVKKRAGWLVILFVGEMLTATAMGIFEDQITKAVVLALFVPLIISSGGNSGSQAATIIIRAMALGDLSLSDWWRVMRREILSGLMLGIILGLVGFLRISTWTLFTDIYGEHWLLVAFTVGFSLIGVVMWGTLSGSMLPIVLRKLGFDPATSSAPFVATIVDVTGLLIYFTVAILFLKGTLL